MARPGGKPVLLLEDQALIAIYVEELLLQAGFETVMTFSSRVAATNWLRGYTPELAIIEARLRDGPCDDIATLLVERDVPYIVHSGERDGDGDHPLMNGKCKWIDKPSHPDVLIKAIKECGARSNKRDWRAGRSSYPGQL